MNFAIQVHNLIKAVRGNILLDQISTEVSKGEVVVVLGPSGAGKSTFLKTLCGLEDFDSGKITINEETLLPHARQRHCPARVGLVSQGYQLFPHVSCRQNIALPPVLKGMMAQHEAAERAELLLQQVGLSGYGSRAPLTLSSGQQQRVAIARALAMNPQVLLFDEPTSALDPEMTHQVLQVMKTLAQGTITLLIVTHHMAFARELATRVLFLESGKLIEDAPRDQFFRSPQSERARQFLEVLK